MRLFAHSALLLAALLLIVQSATCNAGFNSTKFDSPADVEVDISTLKPGAYIRTSWNDHPVLIYRRTAKDIRHLKANSTELADPYNNELAHHLQLKAYIHGNAFASAMKNINEGVSLNPLRAVNDEYLVVDPISSYIGCSVVFVPARDRRTRQPEPGGFHDPCRDVKYDLSGRVLQGHKQGASLNLLVIPHRFETSKKLLIGIGKKPAQISDFRPYVAYQKLPPTQRLVTAARFGVLEQVISAVQAGADVNARNEHGDTALSIAISDVDSGVGEWLLENGANPNIKNLRGGSPPCSAAMGGNEKAIELLGRYGADWELEDKSEPNCATPPLIWAITNTSSEEYSLSLVRMLVEAGANPSATHQGKSALDYAQKAKYRKVVEYLSEVIARKSRPAP